MVRLPVVREASLGAAAPVYERYRPEHTLLYQLVEENYSTFKAHLAAQGSALPGYVEREAAACSFWMVSTSMASMD